MSEVISSVVAIVLTFVTSLFFGAYAISRSTLISSALAAICWLSSGALNFIFDPLGFGQYVAWIFFIVGAVFVLQLIFKLVIWYQESQNERFQVDPL